MLNHPKAYVKCGDLIYSGKGVGKRDKTEAFKCYQKAAALNDAEAMNNLGLMLENGFDEKLSDHEQALEYYKKAHKLGSTDATINIALYYLNVRMCQQMRTYRDFMLKENLTPESICLKWHLRMEMKRQLTI